MAFVDYFPGIKMAGNLVNKVRNSYGSAVSSAMQNFLETGQASPNAGINNELFQNAAQQQMEYQTQSAERAMQFSAEQAEKNRQWQEQMSSTAYRRAVSDLEEAGLNPILAYTNGPASTPSGSTAYGLSQSGSQANVDTYDWDASKINAFSNVMSAMASMIGSTGKVIDGIIPG